MEKFFFSGVLRMPLKHVETRIVFLTFAVTSLEKYPTLPIDFPLKKRACYRKCECATKTSLRLEL